MHSAHQRKSPSTRLARRTNTLPNRALLAALLLIASASAAPAVNNVDGVWSAVNPWPLIAIHAALTPDGRVLTYGTNAVGTQTGYFIYDIWDPSAGPTGGHVTLNNLTQTDIFCSSQIILPQTGQILINGGDNWTGTGTTNTGNNRSNLFDSTDNSLTGGANMNRARWYSSSTALINGEVYIQGGSGGADFPEVRQQNGAFRLLTNTATSNYAALFPRNFLAPDGRVFGYDTNGNMYFVAPSGLGSISPAGQFSSTYAGWTSGAAMFAPGRIVQMGGNSNLALVIDINGPVPTVAATDPMSSQRQWVSATVLPNGQVLATGGSQVENQLTNVNNSAEIWNPGTGHWHVGTSGVKARLYHSSALLLPDATVLVAGGGAPGPQVNTNAEIYFPPYLFDATGALAARPQIVSAPDIANVGDTLTLQVDTPSISRVTLIKSGSVTHSVNMDQRFIELPFTSSGNVLYANLPVRASDTPPGFYLLFAIDAAGVPSRAKIIYIDVDTTPNVAVDYTPTVGGAGGGAFQLACAADETLVGVRGNSSTYVNQVGPRCVKVNQFGQWIGDPVNRTLAGTTTTGTSYAKTCPRDFAVSGFRARASQYVDQLDFQCRPLTASGGMTGTATYLGPVGGTGGTAQGPFACPTDNPAYALYGRAGSWLDNFGVQCRSASVTPVSVNSSPVIVNPGAQSGVVGNAVNLTLAASDGDGDALTFSASNLPQGLTLVPSTGLISGTLSTAGVYTVTVTVSDGSLSNAASFQWSVANVAPLVVDPLPPAPRQLVNTPVTYSASAHGGQNVVYKWNFGDGTPETSYSSSPTISHTFTRAGIYYATLTVTGDGAAPSIQSFAQLIQLPATANAPRQSTNLVYETRSVGNARVWVVNQDNDSVSVIDAVTRSRLKEVVVGKAPRAIAIAPDKRIWVTNKFATSISVIDPDALIVVQTIALPNGSQPYGLVISPVTNEAFVALEASGSLIKLDASSGAQLGSVAVGAHPRHVAIDGAGATVYVSRFITPPQPGEATAVVGAEVGGVKVGGEVLRVNAASMAVLDTIYLQHSDKPDAETQGGGVPNYLGALVISPDGSNAVVPSNQDNIARGTLRSTANLNFQNTVRAIASSIDPNLGGEVYSRRIDFDNASLTSAALYEPSGMYGFFALETSRQIAIVDAHASRELFRFNVGIAPQGLAISPDGLTLFVNNFMDRTVGIYDLTDLQTNGQWNVTQVATVAAITSEKLSAQVLLGKQLFYDAADTRLARDRYLSCASCHNDGGYDGRTWDLTGMGEGLRNTITLRGTAASHGFSHWSKNFDEIQDFEGQIRNLAGGTGLMSDTDFLAGTRSAPLGDPKAGLSADLDALAAYVASLNEYPSSPYRNADNTLTSDGAAGREIFRRENCAACHSGVKFTDSATAGLHDIGTLKPTSGSRLGGPLLGIDTPTLRGVWATGPYLHDGSAASLSAAVGAHQGVALNATDMTLLVAYLKQVDVNEPTAPVTNSAPTISSTPVLTATEATAYSYDVNATDADAGDVLTYSLDTAPAGMTINAASGLIGWTPTSAQVGSNAVTARAADGRGGFVTQSFTVVVAAANRPPTITNPGNRTNEVGVALTLAITASDADGDPLTYSAVGLPAGLAINGTTGVISGTPTAVATNNATVTVRDAVAQTSTTFSWTTRDTTPPSTPDRPNATYPATGIQLNWVASTDNVGVTGYFVYRSTDRNTNGTRVATVSGTSWLDTSAVKNVAYFYRLQAYDGAGNLSAIGPYQRALRRK